MQRNAWFRGLSVSGDGTGVVALAGSAAVRLLADRVGLTSALSTALTRRTFVPVHDRGQVLVDLATVLAAGGEAIADIDTLRHEPLWGPVASPATVWRTLAATTPDLVGRIAKARARVRRLVWAQLPDGLPASPAAGTHLGETVVIDIDATLVTAHSEKQQAAANFKGGFGFHPLGAWCDNTGEMLAVALRPGNANANHAGDHIAVLGEAVAQIPAAYRRRLLVRADTAGATHQLLDWLTAQNQIHGRSLDYSIGFPVHKGIAVHDAIHQVPETAWQTALDTDGDPRDHAGVVEITGLVDLATWPVGMRLIVRREKPHPGAGLTLFEQADGWRYQAFATNTTSGQLGFLEARHRAHARVEDRIRAAKDTGLGRLPSREFAINSVWVQIAAIAVDLTCWLQLLAVHDAPALARAEPKLLRFRMLHVPAQLTRGGRQRRLRIPTTWPWAAAIATAFARIAAIPAPT
jgi:Transposase DDE domain group 1